VQEGRKYLIVGESLISQKSVLVGPVSALESVAIAFVEPVDDDNLGTL
jgi:hypothetical protein